MDFVVLYVPNVDLVAGNDDFHLREFDPLPMENPLQFEHKARLVGGKISGKNMITEGLTTIKIMSLR